jgi:hypothetical protein
MPASTRHPRRAPLAMRPRDSACVMPADRQRVIAASRCSRVACLLASTVPSNARRLVRSLAAERHDRVASFTSAFYANRSGLTGRRRPPPDQLVEAHRFHQVGWKHSSVF